MEVSSPNGDHTKIKTDKELSKMAGVGTGTYRMGKKILYSDNEDVKQAVLFKNLFVFGGTDIH